MHKSPVNLACETCKFFMTSYHLRICYFCYPCDRYGICEECCVKCKRSIMYNNKSRYYKTYYEIKSFIEEYLYRHDTIAFICIPLTLLVISIILGILTMIVIEILFKFT
jgi:hypothetical protein